MLKVHRAIFRKMAVKTVAVNGELFEVESRYTNLKFIGGGAYGSCFFGRHEEKTGNH